MDWKALEYYRSMSENEKDLYNGRSIEYIESNMHPNIHEIDRKQYLSNCRKVIELQTTGYNLNEISEIKNRNFEIVNNLVCNP